MSRSRYSDDYRGDNPFEIYIVEARCENEAATAVRAFDDESEATAFRDQCTAHSRALPSPPLIEDTPENDAMWQKYLVDEERWRESHPAGSDNASAESFHVLSVPFQAARGATPMQANELRAADVSECADRICALKSAGVDNSYAR